MVLFIHWYAQQRNIKKRILYEFYNVFFKSIWDNLKHLKKKEKLNIYSLKKKKTLTDVTNRRSKSTQNIIPIQIFEKSTKFNMKMNKYYNYKNKSNNW